MRSLSALCFVVLAAGVSIGCDDESAAPAASGSGNPAAAASPGPTVKKSSELVGIWYRNGEAADPLGLEFTQDGRVSAIGTPSGNRPPMEVTLKYELLEGGRLRLAVPGNEANTLVIQCNVNGDTLSVKPETASLILDLEEGSFTRLPAGKTVVARHAERLKEIAAEQAAAVEKLGTFLSSPGLAIVPVDGAAGSLHVALNVKPDGGAWHGTAYLTVGDTTFERAAQVLINQTTPPTVTCTLGPVSGPPGAPPMRQESFTFNVATRDGALELRDNAFHLLKSDASVNERLAGAYAAELKKRRDALDAFHAQLGTLVIAEEEQQGNARPMRVGLMREADTDTYKVVQIQGSATSLVPSSFNLPFNLVLVEGKPELRSQGGQQMIRVSKPEGGKAAEIEAALDGYIRPLKVTKLLSDEDLKANRAALDAFVAGLATTPVKVGGRFYQSFTYENGYVRPIELTLGSADGKQLAGTFHAKVFDLDLPIAGEIVPTLLGNVLKFKLNDIPPAMRGERFDEGGAYTMELSLVDGKPVLLGKVQPGDGANRLELGAPSDADAAALRKQFDDHLAKGGAFAWARTGNTGGSIEVMSIVIAPPADEKLTGTVNFRRSAAPFAGEIKVVDGMTVLDLDIAETPPKSVATGTMRLWIVPYGDSFYLSGSGKWKTDQKARFVCYGPAMPK